MPNCQIHNKEMRAGKFAGSWFCSTKIGEDNGRPVWCKYKPAKDGSPSGKFNETIDRAASQMDSGRKDETITRLAIAKSMIESGHAYTLETVKEMERWLAWAQGRAQTVTPPEVVKNTGYENLTEEQIPF